MLDAPERAKMLAEEAEHPTHTVAWWRSLHATSTRRALLLTALGGLLIAGVLTAMPGGEGNSGLASNAIQLGMRGAETFGKAKGGDCLNWPEQTPDAAEVVDCKGDHRFEVAEAVDMRTFPGSEYGPDAAPPSPARIQQISQEQCQVAVRRYLGERFDPNSRFTVSMMWSGDKAWRQSGERRMLCGLQLPGPNSGQLAFQGKVADIDQSKVWPAGTCLGIDPSTNQPTDIPVDCAGPHAMEVTGSVNVGEKFPNGLPPEPDQDAFIKDACTRMTDAYSGAHPAAQHHAHADLQHHRAAELVGRQPSGVLQHRRHARQRRLVDTAQQRQGPTADQRPTAHPATGHPRGAAELPADPDARYPCADRRQQHPVRPERLLLPADPADPAWPAADGDDGHAPPVDGVGHARTTRPGRQHVPQWAAPARWRSARSARRGCRTAGSRGARSTRGSGTGAGTGPSARPAACRADLAAAARGVARWRCG